MRIDGREARRKLNELVEREVVNKKIPSISYILVDENEILCVEHVQGKGSTPGHPLNEDTVFRVGSCSKMFTAIALMQLVERGLVDLDADISTYLPDFNPENPFATHGAEESARITLRKLLSHMSGLVREPGVGHYLDDCCPPLAATVESVREIPLKHDPQAGVFRYSNAGFAVVGHVVERVSGQEFTAHMQECIVDPIGMESSSFVLTSELKHRLAPAYMWSMDGDFPAPVFDLGGAPAGNLYASLPDMAEFVKVLLNGGYVCSGRRIVKPATLHLMWEPIAFSGRMGYGLGFVVGDLDGWKMVGHGGAIYGYATQCVVLPEARVGAVVCSTLDATNVVAGRIARYALRLLLASKRMGKVPSPPECPQPITAAHLATLPGFYQDTETGEVVEVKVNDGKLYLMGDGLPLRIQPRTDWTFMIDGRAFGPGSEYPHLEVVFSPPCGSTETHPSLKWKGRTWTWIPQPAPEAPPEELVPYIGEYGPDFNVARIFYQNRAPRCLIEYFYTHALEKIGEGIYRMHGLLYEDENLVLNARDEGGNPGIRIGPMFLKRRR